MRLRTRVTLSLGLLAAVTAAAIGWFGWVATGAELRHEVDRSLLEVAEGHETPFFGRDSDMDLLVFQLLGADGSVQAAPTGASLPVDDADRLIARSGGEDLLRDVEIGEAPFRSLTTGLQGGGALQVARPISELVRILDGLRTRTIIAVVVAAAIAALLGWLLSRQVTRRLVQLTGIVGLIARTGELIGGADGPPREGPPDGVAGLAALGADVGGARRDEVGDLAAAFEEMLGALAAARGDQQRLVEDAGHELRTPLTSLRTNLGVLARHPDMDPEDRRHLLHDLESESRELSALVEELVSLATDQAADEDPTAVDLGQVAQRVADRARRRHGRTVEVRADGSRTWGSEAAIERAMTNLVDNACKFADDGLLELVIDAGDITMHDRGPGIAETELQRVFDRFHRTVAARSRPGSGLGLSIVQSVAQAHGGVVHAANRPGGGAAVGFSVALLDSR